jgi:hypothetical protein
MGVWMDACMCDMWMYACMYACSTYVCGMYHSTVIACESEGESVCERRNQQDTYRLVMYVSIHVYNS